MTTQEYDQLSDLLAKLDNEIAHCREFDRRREEPRRALKAALRIVEDRRLAALNVGKDDKNA